MLTLHPAPPPLYSFATPTRALPPGTELLASPPLCVIPLSAAHPHANRCWTCLDLVEEPVVCGRCREETYCSRECKQSAWETYHSAICRSLPAVHYALAASRFTSAQSHAALLFLKFVASEFRDDRQAIDRLRRYTDQSIDEIRAQSAQGHLDTFLHLLPRPLADPDRQLIVLLLAKCRFITHAGLGDRELAFLLARFAGNNHLVSDERLGPIGHAIVPEISRRVNHACAPAGVMAPAWHPDTKTLTLSVRLIRPLTPGEPVTIPYLDPILPLVDRQTFLRERYGFTCACTLCTFQASLPPAIRAGADDEAKPETLERIFDAYVRRPMDRLRADVRRGTATATATAQRAWLPTRPRMDALPRDEVACLSSTVVQALTSMFGEACERRQWSWARETGQHVLGIYVVVYGWRHPLVGLHLVSLAQVRLNDSPDSTTALEDATLYVRFARECLQTGTSMRGMRREGRCALADEVGEVERACEARWREYRTGEGLLT